MSLQITVIHYSEDGQEWADSPDVPAWTAVGQDRLEVIRLANEGLPFLLERDDLDIRHRHEDGSVPVFAHRITTLPLAG